MKRDIAVIGITEWMSSFFVLITQKLNIDVQYTCNIHATHGAKPRPPVAKVFRADVVDAINKWAHNEIQLWEYAKELHLKQLALVGMDFLGASKLYNSICG